MIPVTKRTNFCELFPLSCKITEKRFIVVSIARGGLITAWNFI